MPVMMAVITPARLSLPARRICSSAKGSMCPSLPAFALTAFVFVGLLSVGLATVESLISETRSRPRCSISGTTPTLAIYCPPA